jgi:hypothetical protein
MPITLNSQTYSHIRNGTHLIDGLSFGDPQRAVGLSAFTRRKGEKYTGGITLTSQSDVVLPSGDTERRADVASLQVIGHSASDIADIRSLVADINAFVQSALFAEYMNGKTEY